MPSCAIKYPTNLKFKLGSRGYAVYKNPITGLISLTDGGTSIYASVNFTYKSRGHMGAWFNTPIIVSNASPQQFGRTRSTFLYIENGSGNKIHPATNATVMGGFLPSPTSSLNFEHLPIEAFGFVSRIWTLKYLGDTYSQRGMCHDDVKNGGTINITAMKSKTRLVSNIPSSINISRQGGNFVVSGGTSTSINTSSIKLQYNNPANANEWIDVPGASLSLKTNTGKTYSPGSLSLSSLSPSKTDQSVKAKFAGSDALLPSSFEFILRYI